MQRKRWYNIKNNFTKSVMVVWYEKILLFSDYKVIYEITYKIIEEDYKLEWRTYDLVEGNQHFVPDAVIMYLDSKMLETGVFELIIKVKESMEIWSRFWF